VTNRILNLKQVRLKQLVDAFESEKAIISVSGMSELTAGEIGKSLTNFKVLNPD
jgi:DNA-directed RNA polymerase subunit alpha